jgi:RNA polymerase sigma-70 factor (ECF subfamily)
MEAALRGRETSAGADDAVLVRQVQSGRTGAFAHLVRRYQDRVFNACLRMCRNPADAEDLSQDVFLKAFDRIRTFEGKSSFYTWIFRIAVNVSLSHRRKARLRLVGSLNGDGEAGPAGDRLLDDRAEDPAGSAQREELRGRVAETLATLEDHQRVILVLRDVEGCDYQQIGKIMDVPIGTVKSRVHRARMALREALERGRPSRAPAT